VKVADVTGLTKTTVGFMLVAFSTSLPELSVAMFAAVGLENIGVAVGNVLGSNIVNVCLILGVCFLLLTSRNSAKVRLPQSFGREEARSLYFGIFIASIIPLTLIYIGYASRFIGILLLMIFLFSTLQLLRKGDRKEKDPSIAERQKLTEPLYFTFLGATGVMLSSYFIMESASFIAVNIGVPRVVIGATIVAFGTSIPELVTSIEATKKGHLDLALGNIVGSGFINTTCILGVALAGSLLNINMAAFSNLVTFSIITNLFLWYFLSNGKTSWREGVVLLFMYFFFLVMSFGGYRI